MNFCFLVGSSRSGTTVLTKILNCNSKIVAPTAEQLFLTSYINHFSDRKSFSEKEIKIIINNLWNLLTINKYIWNINEPKLYQNLSANQNNLTFNQLILHIFYSYNNISDSKNNISCFIDKNPHYIYELIKLNNAFKHSKFIFITRDYRGRFNSIKKVKKYFVKAIGISWFIQQNKILEFIKQHPNKSILIKYEDLVTAPKQTIEKICDFLELEYEDKMLKHYEFSYIDYTKLKINKKTIDSQLKWHGNSNKPIDSSIKEKWKKELTKEEIKLLDYYCGETGKLFGYEPLFQKFSLIDKITIELLHRPLFILIYGFPLMKKLFFQLPIKLQRLTIKAAKKISGIE